MANINKGSSVSKGSISERLTGLFDAERTVRRLHDELVRSDRGEVLKTAHAVVQSARTDQLQIEPEEASLRLVRIASLLSDLTGDQAVDLLIDILDSHLPEARYAAGEALSELAFDRFKEVALGVERALERLAIGSPALAELPFVLLEVPEPGVSKLLGKFLSHADPDAVAAAIEASVELGDPELATPLGRLCDDPREVELESEEEHSGASNERVTLGELAQEAIAFLQGVVENEG